MPNFAVERQLYIQQIRNRLEEIYATVYSQRQPIAPLYRCVTGLNRGPEKPPASGWEPFPIFDRWGGFDQTTWFRMEAHVPESMKGEKVVALIKPAHYSMIPDATGLTEGGEALAYVDGKPRQGLDRNRDEVLLTEKAKGDERFDILLEACPSTRFDLHHLFCYADLAVKHEAPWTFYWDALVPLEVCETLDDNFAPTRRLLELVHDAVLMVDMQHVGQPAYWDSLNAAQKYLRKGLKAFESSPGTGKLTLAGHAHIDTAWLWPLRETKRKCSRTFSTILRLMEQYPEFSFSCSQPQQYAWIKEHYPEIFEGIKQRVKDGRWELCGGAWIEPDHNIPAGESLVRQYLYGNRWFEAEFGKRSDIAWIPDSFGYTWSLPQILRKAQIDVFVTSKIDWSQYTTFPYSFFLWEGIDGTRIPAVMPPLNYNGNPAPSDLREQWDKFKQKERVDELPFPFGYGDGGGGPTTGMIEHGKRLQNTVGVPQCEFGRLSDCVKRMAKNTDAAELPVYNDELYLELHRACQTSQARTKRHNRTCERLLRDAEFLNSLAWLYDGEYPNEALYSSWLTVLTNQFHDLLPGTSITEVFMQAEWDYAEVEETTQRLIESGTATLHPQIDTTGEGTPIVVFNTLSWSRTDVARLRMTLPDEPVSIVDGDGAAMPSQRISEDELLFLARDVPSMGYRVFHLCEESKDVDGFPTVRADSDTLENDFVRVEIDKEGLLSRIYDKEQERDVLAPGEKGNQLQLFDDRPHLYDAWDIDVNFEEKMWTPGPARTIEVRESGPLRAVVRLVRHTDESTITQDITLHAHSPRIDFVTRVDWWEKRTLLKAAFPVAVRASRATYEIQYGAIERPTHDNTAFDRARFEVPAQRWADLSEGDFGVSLLNDCKYGYDVKGHVLRLSLLRSPIDPDPHADEGEHHFTYALYPHGGTWRDGTARSAAELNGNLLPVVAETTSGLLPSAYSFIACNADHVVIDTVKKAEDSGALIVRLYEAYGQRGRITLTFGDEPAKVTECDLMEENDASLDRQGNRVNLSITPYELRTLKVAFSE